jgi:Fe/S biogenesis protein NfuA
MEQRPYHIPTESPAQDAPLVTLTDGAAAKVDSALKGSSAIGVRLTVRREKGSFAYTFDYVAADQVDLRDPVLPCGRWRFYLNHESVDLIRGAEIDYLASGFTQGWVIDNPNPAWDSELARRITAVFERKINPGLAQHGGRVALTDLKDTTAYVEMSGGCQGCSMATKTLRNGIMRVLADEFPELTNVVDTTDHTGGSNPYFKGDQEGASPTF